GVKGCGLRIARCGEDFSRTSTRTTTRTKILCALIVLVLVLVLVLGCSPIAHYYTKVRCLCADVKISSQWPEHLDPETENFNKS
ncbi:MAG: hypothetical protein PVF39_01585, partial [Desulfobacterales bacterium]